MGDDHESPSNREGMIRIMTDSPDRPMIQLASPGGVAEWLKAPVLKTGMGH